MIEIRVEADAPSKSTDFGVDRAKALSGSEAAMHSSGSVGLHQFTPAPISADGRSAPVACAFQMRGGTQRLLAGTAFKEAASLLFRHEDSGAVHQGQTSLSYTIRPTPNLRTGSLWYVGMLGAREPSVAVQEIRQLKLLGSQALQKLASVVIASAREADSTDPVVWAEKIGRDVAAAERPTASKRAVADIKGGRLLGSTELLQLARKAVEAKNSDEGADIDLWARRLGEDVSKAGKR